MTVRPTLLLAMGAAMAEWDLEKYYWPRDRVLRWWDQGWDWDSLKDPNRPAGQCPHPDFNTYADYYDEAFSKTIMIDDPRPGKTGKISEWDYWHDGEDRWLTNFPRGSAHWWTPYHLPLYDLNGNLSPKHPGYTGGDRWTDPDREAFIRSLTARIRKKGNEKALNAPLCGVVITQLTYSSILDEILFVDFSNAFFGPGTSFFATCFGGGVKFRNAVFGTSTSFSDARFDIVITFAHAYFGDVTSFDGATFSHLALFYGTDFGNGASFDKATFGDRSNFTNATLGKNCTFTKSKFLGSVTFSRSSDGQDKYKEQLEFRDSSFFKAEFNSDVDFSGRQFIGNTDFHQIKFNGLAKFYGAELSEETYFTLDDAHWPLPPKPKRRIAKTLSRLRHRIRGNHESTTEVPEPETPSARFEEYEKAFCRLKKIQQGHEARTAEHFFYKLELKARMRRSDIRWTEKFAAGAYGLFSDYGESIGLPLFWLLVSFLIATAVTCCAALPFWQDFAPGNLGFAATAAWHNLVPGDFVKDVFQGCHDEACRSYRYGEWCDHLLTRYGFSLYVVTGLFAACNLALWFLFGLALKRRFQIK